MDSLPPAPDPDPIGDDVARAPGEASDPAEFVARYVPADVLARYEVFSYRNAALILSEAHPFEFGELMEASRRSRLNSRHAGSCQVLSGGPETIH